MTAEERQERWAKRRERDRARRSTEANNKRRERERAQRVAETDKQKQERLRKRRERDRRQDIGLYGQNVMLDIY